MARTSPVRSADCAGASATSRQRRRLCDAEPERMRSRRLRCSTPMPESLCEQGAGTTFTTTSGAITCVAWRTTLDATAPTRRAGMCRSMLMNWAAPTTRSGAWGGAGVIGTSTTRALIGLSAARMTIVREFDMLTMRILSRWFSCHRPNPDYSGGPGHRLATDSAATTTSAIREIKRWRRGKTGRCGHRGHRRVRVNASRSHA